MLLKLAIVNNILMQLQQQANMLCMIYERIEISMILALEKPILSFETMSWEL